VKQIDRDKPRSPEQAVIGTSSHLSNKDAEGKFDPLQMQMQSGVSVKHETHTGRKACSRLERHSVHL